MAKQVIGIGTVANDGTGDPLRTAFDKVNDNFTELYNDDAGDVNSVTAGTGISVNQTTGAVIVTNSDPNANHTGDVTGATSLTIASGVVTNAKMAADSVDSAQYVDGSIDTVHLSDDVITYAKLGTEFTTSAALSTNVDFATAQVFTKTLTANTTLTFSNTEIGMVKDLVITGNFTLTLPAGTTVAGEYDGTVSNLIQVVVTGAAEYWYSISKSI